MAQATMHTYMSGTCFEACNADNIAFIHIWICIIYALAGHAS